jgi:hypothetical protein
LVWTEEEGGTGPSPIRSNEIHSREIFDGSFCNLAFWLHL